MLKFQFYPARVNSKKPLGEVTLFEFLKANQNPSDQIKTVFAQIAQAEAVGDMKTKAELKQSFLYYFTPCVWTDGQGRGYSNILTFTGLLVLDFDHIENASEFKYYLFNEYDCILAGWLSPSKKGVKFLVKIPVVSSVDEFKTYFYGIAMEMEKYKGFDGTGQNAILPLFLSYDPDLLYREQPTTWNRRGKMMNAFVASAVPVVPVNIGEGDKARVQRIIIRLFDSIVSDGHPQVRSAGVTLGGYVASGYIDQSESEEFIYSLIQNNSYLRKGISGYQKTAKTAIQTGTLSQLTLT
jgi:hypothetical protein